ncbi:MAG: SDR family NAD(P)-dependent oxidoreductase [Pseudomonadota bacterium]
MPSTSSGSDRGFALTHAREGMTVVLVAHHVRSLAETATEISKTGGGSLAVAADVSEIEDMKHVADSAIDAFGAVHLLCKNASVGPFGTAQETTLAEWEWVLSVNLWGVIHGIYVFLPLFEDRQEGHEAVRRHAGDGPVERSLRPLLRSHPIFAL